MRKLIFFLFVVGASQAAAQDTTRLSLLFVGDIMQHDSQIRAAKLEKGGYDYNECFQFVKPLIEKADVAIGNLELTLAGPPHKGYPQFSAPDELAYTLKESGFDVLVTANNHSLDRRKRGLERTIKVLDSLNIPHTGTFKDSLERAQQYPLLVEKKGFKFSLLNYTYGTNGIPVTKPNVINLIDTTQIKVDLEKAKTQSPDFVIVFMHWGLEYQDTPSREQRSVANFCLKNGAQLVIGSHPHVLQQFEWDQENNTVVAYSLGNFVSGQQSRYRDGGSMLWVEMEKTTELDSTSNVVIKNVAHDLAWVYRNFETPKKYFILPVKEFESDSILMGKTSRELLKVFAEDSRKLLSSKNKNVNESERQLIESDYYKIHLGSAPDTIQIDSLAVLSFYNITPSQRNDSLEWISEPIYDREVAEAALSDLKTNSPFKEAKLVWYYWGRRQNALPPRKDDAN
ncbi:MAG: CapA family protein [Cyclobacteriaceae bacterium]|nr:CapA family protein [Cyclobacteriaceae bacterium]